MTDKIPYIRVFISSPGDVNDERKIALDVIEQLPYQPVFRDKVAFRIVAWDKKGAGTSMRMSMTPQDAINRGLPKPSDCDIVVVLFWSRMGTPFVDSDGKRFESGTHWELLDALNGKRSKERTVLYRRTEEKSFTIKQTQEREQFERLDTFFQSDMFVNDGVIKGGVNHYEHPDDFREQFTTHFQELVVEILNAQNLHPLDNPTPQDEPDNENLTTLTTEPWNPERSPFPGLRAFTENDSDIFFGRGAETDKLVTQLTDNHFVAVIASSGSGKSSLVGAGLIPRLRVNAIEGSKDWKIVQFTPTNDPFNSLFNALVSTFDNLKTLKAKPVKDAYMQSLRETSDTLNELSHLALEDEDDWAEILLFIDQFEELFTLSSRKDAEAFVGLLNAIADNTQVRVVVTMRADFYQSALGYPQLADMLRQGSFPLALPRRSALRQMIESPAERAGITFENGLIDRILDDVGNEPGNLALMAYALDELYKLDDDGVLTSDEYEKLGGVRGAIGTRADNLWQELELDESYLHQVFLRLIEVDERGTATRRRAEISDDLDENGRHIIESFVQARLLTTGKNPETGNATVEVAHEAILREWTTLSDWIRKSTTDFRIIAKMRRDAEWWNSNGRRDQDLPRTEQIDEFRRAYRKLELEIIEGNDPLLLIFTVDEDIRLFLRLSTSISFGEMKSIMLRLREIGGNRKIAEMAIQANEEMSNPKNKELDLIYELLNGLSETNFSESIWRLAEIFEDVDEYSRLTALQIFVQSPVKQLTLPLIKLLSDEYEHIREISFGLLAELKDNRAVEPLITMLNDESDDIRLVSIAVLSELGDRRAIEPLAAILNDKTDQVRIKSAFALAKFHDSRAVEPLITNLNNSNFSVRINSILALDSLNDSRAVESLILLLEDDNDSVRLETAKALGNLGDRRAVESLILLLEDENDSVRLEIVRALGSLNDSRAVESLILLLEDKNDNIRLEAAGALGDLGDNRAVEPLILLLEDKNDNIRLETARALGDLGDSRAVEPLIETLYKFQSWKRFKIIHVLQSFPESDLARKTVSSWRESLKGR